MGITRLYALISRVPGWKFHLQIQKSGMLGITQMTLTTEILIEKSMT